jgi:hypothetical protein
MLAITADSAKNIAIIAIGVLVAGSVVMAWLVKSLVMKLISVGLMVGLAFAIWTQRAELEDCVQKIQDRVDAGQTAEATCTIFGQDVTVPGTD